MAVVALMVNPIAVVTKEDTEFKEALECKSRTDLFH